MRRNPVNLFRDSKQHGRFEGIPEMSPIVFERVAGEKRDLLLLEQALKNHWCDASLSGMADRYRQEA